MRQGLLAVPLALAGAVVQAGSSAEPPLRLERKVELPEVRGRIDHLAVDVRGQRLFVAALGNDTVEVIDLAAGRRAHTIRGLAEPQGVLFEPGENRLFVANGRDGSVRIFDASSFAPTGRLRCGDDADNLRLDAARRQIWVGYGRGALAAIDASGRRLGEVVLPVHPESFQLERDGPRIFVNLPDAGQVAVVDREKRAQVASWGTGEASANYPMALDEPHRRLFVVCRTPARLLVLDTGSGRQVAALPTVGDADDVFYDAAAGRV
ncbi:MAG: YncE family protein, partial [Betaproteobacteria bacterium]